MQDHFTRLRDRRGGTMALIAVTLTGLLAAMSLAVDMGQFFTARAEAQRVADAAALAGASSFMSFWPDSATAHDTAVARAMDIATTNNVRGDFVDPNDVAVQVLYSEEKVRVHVRKLGLGTWFGRFAERFNIDVSTSAAARAIPSEGPTCVKPWAIPDLWYEVDGTSSGNGGNWRPNTDSIADGMWQEEEGVWQLGDHADEYYSPYGDNHVDGDTGYGSNYRFDNYGWPDQHDWGVQLIVKPADPNNATTISSPFFFVWQIDSTKGGGGAVYQDDIINCAGTAVYRNADYPIEPGDMIGPTNHGVNELLAKDPEADWNVISNELVPSSLYPGVSSPRIITVALFDPNLIPGLIGSEGPGTTFIRFNNFAKVFLEEDPNNGTYNGQEPIFVRFMGFAVGTKHGGPNSGSLVKRPVLVE